MKKILLFIFVVISCVCIHDTISRVYYKQTVETTDLIVYDNLLSGVASVDKKVYAKVFNINPNIDIHTRIQHKLAELENTSINPNDEDAKLEYLNDVNRVKLRVYEINRFKSINSFYLYITQLFATFDVLVFVIVFISFIIFIVISLAAIYVEENTKNARAGCKYIMIIFMIINTILFILTAILTNPASFVTINSRFMIMLLIDILLYCIVGIFNYIFLYYDKTHS